jgi:hypothetical protein
MAIGFTTKDILHKIVARFAPSTLPGAKKPYRLKPARRIVLDIHELASKAEMYNISIDPTVIETGMAAGLKLMGYLLADGYSFNTPLFKLHVNIPGEYDGTETNLPEGVFPEARFRPSPVLRRFLEEEAKVVFSGKEDHSGYIGTAVDETTGREKEVVTARGLLTISGRGLKIQTDEAHRNEAGLYFEGPGGTTIKAENAAINKPRTLRVMVPADLQTGVSYTLLLRTQGAANGKGTLLKELREIRADFTLRAC